MKQEIVLTPETAARFDGLTMALARLAVAMEVLTSALMNGKLVSLAEESKP